MPIQGIQIIGQQISMGVFPLEGKTDTHYNLNLVILIWEGHSLKLNKSVFIKLSLLIKHCSLCCCLKGRISHLLTKWFSPKYSYISHYKWVKLIFLFYTSLFLLRNEAISRGLIISRVLTRPNFWPCKAEE